MAIYDHIDIETSASGDFVLNSSKDLKMAAPSGCLKQDIMFRARTDLNDFVPHPDIGADLQRFIGGINNRENAAIAEDRLFDSLSKDSRIYRTDLRVKAVPISSDRIAIYTFVNASNLDIGVFTAVVLDYDNGILNTPGGGE
jgi:hypothetical protein